MTEHERLLKISRKHLWLPFTQMKDYDAHPLIIESGEGIMLKDTEGKNVLRRFFFRLVECARTPQAGAKRSDPPPAGQDRAFHVAGDDESAGDRTGGTFGGTFPPPRLTRVFYSDSGAEAVEIALKIAFQYWKNKGNGEKSKFVTMKNGYHGDTIEAISVGSIDIFHKTYESLMFDSYKVPYPYVYRYPGGDAKACKAHCLAELERLFAERHREIAGFIRRVDGARSRGHDCDAARVLQRSRTALS